jgi:preprotein translocase subunit SecY
MSEWIIAVTAMTAGSVLLMWLGELITEQGIGNGISTLIFASIISQLPTAVITIWNSVIGAGGSISVFGWFDLPIDGYTLAIISGFLAFILLILYILVKINEAQRIITINYAKRVHGNSSYGGIKSILPIKLIAAGVIPVIFAVAFLSLPSFIGQVIRSADASSAVANKLVLWFSAPNPGTFTGETWESFIYPVTYFLLVVGFTYFYSSIIFNSKEISDNLQRQGGFIEGVRPGKSTATHLSKTVSRLNLFGSLALGLIAMLPFVADLLFYFFTGAPNAQLSISGTGLLIVVAVALESLRQLNSRALMITYDDYKNEPES